MRMLARFLISVSLFLCLVLAGLWISSHKATWRITCERPEDLWEVQSGGGSLVIERVTGWPGWDMLGISRSMQPDMTTLRERWGIRTLEGQPLVMQIYSPRAQAYVISGGGSFHVGPHSGLPKDYRARRVIVPYAWPVGVLALPVLLAGAWRSLGTRRAARRRRQGLCVKCGYDVRASEGRCPECGEAISR